MFKMVRPKKIKIVEKEPKITYFKPRAVPLSEIQEVTLSLEELEVMKLKFNKNLDHEEAAKKMKISRTTIGRILNSAGKKITDALTNGKAIKIQGGNYKIK